MLRRAPIVERKDCNRLVDDLKCVGVKFPHGGGVLTELGVGSGDGVDRAGHRDVDSQIFQLDCEGTDFVDVIPGLRNQENERAKFLSRWLTDVGATMPSRSPQRAPVPPDCSRRSQRKGAWVRADGPSERATGSASGAGLIGVTCFNV